MITPVETTGLLIAGGHLAKKVLGPTLEELGEDIKNAHRSNCDKLIHRAADKVENLEDGQCANLRVARDILWNGAFSENEICVEYYSGLLVAARSADGVEDELIPFVDVVKSLASRQIKLHYDIFWSMGRMIKEANSNGEKISLYDHNRVRLNIFIAGHNVQNIELDLQVLFRKGLISEYKFDNKILERNEREEMLPFYSAVPTRFGVMLYAAAHNQLQWWRALGLRPFVEFKNVETPKTYGRSLEELLTKLGQGCN